MTRQPKQIVLDKSAFEAFGLDDLCNFAKHHFLVAPGVLLYECATSPRREPMKLLERYKKLIREGACCCPHGHEFVEWEAQHCRPYPWDLAMAEDTTQRICRNEVQFDDLLDPAETGKWERSRTRHARERYIELSEIAKRRVDRDCPSVREEIKAFPSNRAARLRYILDLVDTRFDIHDMAIRSVRPELIRQEEQFCPSDAWMIWHRVRLGSVVAIEYYYKRQTGGVPPETTAEHDDQDAEYVLLLSRADGIITKDKKLVEPLSRAAFPEKDVFSSLEEVPESYRCDWTHN